MFVTKQNRASAASVQAPADSRARLVSTIAAHAACEGLNQTAIPELLLSRRSVPSACTSTTYEPGLILFFQGKKRINIGKITYLCGDSSLLLTSVDLPVVSQVITATTDEPMLAMILLLDMTTVRELLNKEEFDHPDDSSDTLGMSVSMASEEILDAFSRLNETPRHPCRHSIPEQFGRARNHLSRTSELARPTSVRDRNGRRSEEPRSKGCFLA